MIHRRNLSEVFLTDARKTGEDSFAAAALLPLAHPHYTSQTGSAPGAVDPMLLLECCRQAETYAAHAFYGIDMDDAFILRNWSADLAADIVTPAEAGPGELVLTAVTRNPRQAAGRLRSLEYDFDLMLAGASIGQVRMAVGYTARQAYLSLRARHRGSPPPSSGTMAPTAGGQPVAPVRAGRINATDTLLLDVAPGPDEVTAVLRVPAENPSLFDHDQDHVPAMVLVEAARQIAVLATEEWGGAAADRTAMVAMQSSFSAYAELDQAITMTAERASQPADAPAGHQRPVDVTFRQGGAEISRAQVVTATVRRPQAKPRQGAGSGTTDRAAVMAGLGAWTPEAVLANQELAASFGVDQQWIYARTGISQRHLVAPGEGTGDLAVQAGRRALKSAGVTSADAVILATSTPDRLCPATAPETASRLGLGGVPAFDLSAVCSGFIYALGTGAGLIAAGTADRVLVIGADTFSTILDPADRSARSIFGDGAGAVLLRAGSSAEPGALQGLNLGSDGSQCGLIEVPGGGSRQRSTGMPVKEEDTYFRMEGRAVFSHAVRRMSAAILETTRRMQWSPDEVTWFVLHQANARILAAIARRLGLPVERFLSNIDQVGNTAAASIPMALADGAAAGQLRPGQRVVLASFGGGLAWGSAALTWPAISTG